MFRLVPEVSYALILSDFCFVKKNLKLSVLPYVWYTPPFPTVKVSCCFLRHCEGEHFSWTSPGLSWTAHLSKINRAKLQAINLKHLE